MREIAPAGRLRVKICNSREEMGKTAAARVVDVINDVLRIRKTAHVIFAAAPSQDEFLSHLAASDRVDWSRVIGFQMDEYIHLDPALGQLFSQYLTRHLLSKMRMGAFHAINSQAPDPELECRRYAMLLEEFPPDVVCLGIGENGHIAFNDPPVADFRDPAPVKVVEIDEVSRLQQVHDGCFPGIDQVPGIAMTLTIPALMAGRSLSVVVPARQKAVAVRNTILAPLDHTVPATILRTHEDAVLFLDPESASLL